MIREKYNLIQELERKSEELNGKGKYSLIGQGDFQSGNNPMRCTMNNKHHQQHLTIYNPNFPMLYDGKENITGKYSSFYTKTDKTYRVVNIVKKYNELLKGKCYFALYFLYCKEDDSYLLVERKEVENLTECFGFDYKNDYLDDLEVGDEIPPDMMLTSSTSYDEYGNVSIGVNGRILYAVDPAVQDDAIEISESFAKKMVTDKVMSINVSITENTILLNLYGENGKFQGLPNIGDHFENGIVCATRTVKETRMFSDLRDISLCNIAANGDQPYYGTGEVIDINVYCNNHNLKKNKANEQLIQYNTDARWFYTDVYKTCKSIIKSGSPNIDPEIHHWMKIAKDHLDLQAQWAINDNTFNNIMIDILLREKESASVGRKITGRHGNKTVICKILPDEKMPYLTTEVYTDQYGVVHPKGVKERVDLITNPLAIINRTIPMALVEGSITFIIDTMRKHMATLDSIEEQEEFMFDILGMLNPKQCKEVKDLYNGFSAKEKRRFMDDCISLNSDGTLSVENGIYVRWEAFNTDWNLRDAIIKVYDKYGDILKPYHIFMPKPKWGRDIYVGQDYIGYQYIMVLKQSGEKGFSVRSAGAISDESLPEKDHASKQNRDWHSSKPIRFGEYELTNFLTITNPEDWALVSALYRTSVDGRRYMYEAIIDEDNKYNIPDSFSSRTAEVMQVYLKSLGVRMETINDEDEVIGEPEHMADSIMYQVGRNIIQCTTNEMYYLKKLHKLYKRFMKHHNEDIYNVDEVWDYITENLTFKKKHLTDRIVTIFKENLVAFSQY